MLRVPSGILAASAALALCGCAVERGQTEPVGPVPSPAEIRSLLGAPGGTVADIAQGRASVMIEVTPLVVSTGPTPGPADLNQMTIVAACVLSKSSGGPRGFATGVMPTNEVTEAIKAKALAGEYRSLLGDNCAPQD